MAKDFSRDLGYLDKFLQGLHAHAGTLGEPASSRLAALLDEQERVWGEIRGLLTGTPEAAGAPTGDPGPGTSSAPTAGSGEAAALQASADQKRFTVGSMIS